MMGAAQERHQNRRLKNSRSANDGFLRILKKKNVNPVVLLCNEGVPSSPGFYISRSKTLIAAKENT
jgi:hypothetical protein